MALFLKVMICFQYAGLKVKFPETAEKLFAEAQVEADKRYDSYVRLEKSFNEQ